MKNRYLAIFFVLSVLLMLVLSGCLQQPVQEEEEEPEPIVSTPRAEPEPERPAKEPVAMSEPEPEPEPEPQRVMSKKVQQVLEKNEGRVSSIRYMYSDETIKPEEWETWVTKDLMHIKLREMDNIRDDVYIDNVYLNLRTRTAEGYCERNAYRCTDPNTPVQVNFNKYYRETPWEWINKVTYAEHDGTEQMQMRTMHKLIWTEDGKDYTMWIDDYYGLPAMVQIKEDGDIDKYIFEDISFNTIDEKDLTHQAVTTQYRD